MVKKTVATNKGKNDLMVAINVGSSPWTKGKRMQDQNHKPYTQ